jgi:hypothetical protein
MKRLPLRFPAELGPRLERLLAEVSKDAEFRAVRMSVSAVIRMALYEGLETLERRYGLTAQE